MEIPHEKCERKAYYSFSPPTWPTPIKMVETHRFLSEMGNNKETLDIFFDSLVELYVLVVWPLSVVVSNGGTLLSW